MNSELLGVDIQRICGRRDFQPIIESYIEVSSSKKEPC